MRTQTTSHTHTIQSEEDNISIKIAYNRIFEPTVLTVDEINNHLPQPPFTETVEIEKVWFVCDDFLIDFTEKIGSKIKTKLENICYKSIQ
jgi:hypothetical protein